MMVVRLFGFILLMLMPGGFALLALYLALRPKLAARAERLRLERAGHDRLEAADRLVLGAGADACPICLSSDIDKEVDYYNDDGEVGCTGWMHKKCYDELTGGKG